jgi:hypothetical protein
MQKAERIVKNCFEFGSPTAVDERIVLLSQFIMVMLGYLPT